MKTFIEILENEKIPFRRINSKGQSEMLEILKRDLCLWLKKVIKNQGLKLEIIDATVLIFKN